MCARRLVSGSSQRPRAAEGVSDVAVKLSVTAPSRELSPQQTTEGTEQCNADVGRKWECWCGGTYPLVSVCKVCSLGRHSSQKYLSGTSLSSTIPTHPPCCHTLQPSHEMKRPPASSDSSAAASKASLSGGPGYSCWPHMQRVTSSSSAASSSTPLLFLGGSSSFGWCARWLRRGGSLISSLERECGVADFGTTLDFATRS